MLIRPAKIVDLEHRAYFLKYSRNQLSYFFASEDGHISVLDSNFELKKQIRPCDKLRAISPHPKEKLLAVIDGTNGKLSVVNLADNETLFSEKAHTTANYGFLDCFFNDTGDYLWCISDVSENRFEVQLREALSGSLLNAIIFKDPLWGSSPHLYSTSNTDIILLYLAAGQHGQLVYWLTRGVDELSYQTKPILEDTSPPIFSPNGKQFLIEGNGGQYIRKYNFPDLSIADFCQHSYHEYGMIEEICYLNDELALAGMSLGHLFFLDTRALTILEEILIATSESKQLETDLTFFERLGDVVIFVYRRAGNFLSPEWRDSLLCIPVKSFFEQ